MKQLRFPLNPPDIYSWQYFVPHSGVAEAANFLMQSLEEFVAESSLSKLIYLHGPQGCGKTHLLNSFVSKAVSQGVEKDKIFVSDLDHELPDREIDDQWVSAFVSNYEQQKKFGGMNVLCSRKDPKSLSDNPHLVSRLLNGVVLELSYPREEELSLLLRALSERRNLNLSDYSISFLLKRLPSDPLSFHNILVKIDDLAMELGKSAKLSILKEVVTEKL